MKQSKIRYSFITLCFLEYFFYSLFSILMYTIIGRIHTNDFSFEFKDLLIFPASPIAILWVEGIPYFLLFNLILSYILIFKFKKTMRSTFIISTLAAHFMQYLVLLFIDFNKYSHISMSHDTLTFDKIFVIIPSVLISILIVWLLKRKSYNLSTQLKN